MYQLLDHKPDTAGLGLNLVTWFRVYRGTSLIRKCSPLDSAVGLCLDPYGGPRWGESFLRVSYQGLGEEKLFDRKKTMEIEGYLADTKTPPPPRTAIGP